MGRLFASFGPEGTPPAKAFDLTAAVVPGSPSDRRGRQCTAEAMTIEHVSQLNRREREK